VAADVADENIPPDRAAPIPVPVTPGAEQQPSSEGRPFRRRFLFFYMLLAAAIGATVAGVILAAGSSLTGGGTAWSNWKPTGGGQGAAKQIAAHVSQGYHLASGEQLVDVISKAPSVSPANQQIPIHYLAVRGAKGSGDEIIQVSSDDSVMFSLCGLGTSCAIEKGKPSVERGTLVRRQILELALYTFKYVPSVKHIIAFMPPTPGNQPQYVVYLQKHDVEAQLKVPLVQTLSEKVPLPSSISRKEQQTIDAVTEPRVYKFSLSQAQQGDAILVLAPLSA
jgi:hypothetical protein